MKHLDLFSGIGGFALAARWVGWETIGFCEIDLYCQKVLAKNFPGVPIHDDIKTYTAGPADIITAGWPCQDISAAGTGAGLRGERSGLWSELRRVIGEVRPRFAVMENVSALLCRGLGEVLGDLAEIGYDAEWHCIPAAAAGAPHYRDRIWIIAYPVATVREQPRGVDGPHRESASEPNVNGTTQSLADADSKRQSGIWVTEHIDFEIESGCLADRCGAPGRGNGTNGEWWATESGVRRVADGVPGRVDRLRGLGNAIVPQVAEIIFRAIDATS